jgi:hypothetical protein
MLFAPLAPMRDAREELRGVFNVALASVATAFGAAAVVGCGGEDTFPPGIEGDPGFVHVSCSDGLRQWLAGLNPTVATEYMEFRTGGTVGESRGIRCGGAPDPSRCESDFEALTTSIEKAMCARSTL